MFHRAETFEDYFERLVIIYQEDTWEKGQRVRQGPDDSGLMDPMLNPGAQILSCRWLIAMEDF